MTIYYIPVQIWEAIGFGIKVGFVAMGFVLAIWMLTKDADKGDTE